MTDLLTLSQKLEFLWQDVLSFVKEGVDQGGYPKSILANFKPLTKRKVQGLISEAKRFPTCSTCSSNCCSRVEGKILLTLKDVARLVDAGKADAVEGTFRGFSDILDKYLSEHSPNVLDEVGVGVEAMMSETKTETSYMPSLKKTGNRCIFLDDTGRCSAYAIRPESCRRYPFDFDYNTHWITWDPACTSTTPLEAEQEASIIKNVVCSDNERLRDIALVMLNRDALVQIGYGDYL